MRAWIAPAVLTIVTACGVCPAPRNPAPSPRPSLCWTRGRPAPAASAQPPDEYCSAIDATERARVEARLRKEIVGAGKSAKLVVDFGCDHTMGEIHDVVFEDGSGHGGSLRIAHIQRDAASASASVREIAYSDDAREVVARSGNLPVAAFDAAVGASRVALLAKPHLVPLAPHDGSSTLGISFDWSSNDFHLRLGLADDEGRVTDRSFTGYDSSAEQMQIVPMRMATEPWTKLLAAASLTPVAAGDDDRRFFTSRLVSTFADHPEWWVAERYVAVTATLGTIDAVPTLVALLSKKEKTNASDERMREGALAAIAAITGWDPRIDAETHTARTTDEAVRAVIAECSPWG